MSIILKKFTCKHCCGLVNQTITFEKHMENNGECRFCVESRNSEDKSEYNARLHINQSKRVVIAYGVNKKKKGNGHYKPVVNNISFLKNLFKN